MDAALSQFLVQVKSIEKTIHLRDLLVSFGQDAPKNLPKQARDLRQFVKEIGLLGMQPSLEGSILLLAAAFEQFVSEVITEFVANLPYVVPAYNDLPNAVRSANERLTGEALDRRRSRFSDYELRRFVDNLRNCQAGVEPYVLNGEAIALNERGLTPSNLRDLIRRLGLQDVWVTVASTGTLKYWSGRGGAKYTQSLATTQLRELIDTRNRIAHGLGGATVGPDVLRSYLRFERALARSLVKGLKVYASSL